MEKIREHKNKVVLLKTFSKQITKFCLRHRVTSTVQELTQAKCLHISILLTVRSCTIMYCTNMYVFSMNKIMFKPKSIHISPLSDLGWSGGAMVLGKLPVPGRPTIWITVGQGPTALVVGAGGGCLDIFTLIYPFLSCFSLSLKDGPI